MVWCRGTCLRVNIDIQCQRYQVYTVTRKRLASVSRVWKIVHPGPSGPHSRPSLPGVLEDSMHKVPKTSANVTA